MMISEDDISALLGCYVAYGGDSLSTFWDSLSGPIFKVQEILIALLFDFFTLEDVPIGCPETSIGNFHYWLHNIVEESGSYILRGGSVK